MSVLIVDDAAFMRKMIADIVIKNNIPVAGEAKDGEEAIAKYKVLRPSIVTMDITMPNVDGIEAIKGIIEFDSNAKIIVCSAMGQETLVIKAVKAGAKGFLVKPINESKLIEEIRKNI